MPDGYSQCCKAFTKAFKPCRGYGNADGLCRHHIDFYSDSYTVLKFVLKHPRLFYRPSEWVARILKECDTDTVHMLGTFQPVSRERRDYVFQVGALHRAINPIDVPKGLWMRNVGYMLVSLASMPTRSKERYRTLLRPFLVRHRNGNESRTIFSRIVELMNSPSSPLPLTVWMNYTGLIFMDVWHRDLAFENFTDLFDTVFTPTVTPFHPNYVAMQQELRDCINLCKHDDRLTMRAARDSLKEELVAKVFHPDRILPRVEQFGIDIIDDL